MGLAPAYQLELFKGGIALVLLLLTWFFGQRITSNWELKKKYRELDVAIAHEFQQLFGHFKELWRIWRAHYRSTFHDAPPGFVASPGLQKSKDETPRDLTRWQLFKSAAAAEGKLEAIVVKIAAERQLDSNEIRTLGLYRQAYQQLREAIRDGHAIDWRHNDREYRLFNELGLKSTYLILRNRGSRPSEKRALETLKSIQAYRKEHWLDAVSVLPAQPVDV